MKTTLLLITIFVVALGYNFWKSLSQKHKKRLEEISQKEWGKFTNRHTGVE